MTQFKDLAVGQSFDFVGEGRFNSFYKRCVKVSERKYVDEEGMDYQVGSIRAEVFHVSEKPAIISMPEFE